MLKKWGIWIVGGALMVTPLLILLFFWIALDTAADSLSAQIGQIVMARTRDRELPTSPDPTDELSTAVADGDDAASDAFPEKFPEPSGPTDQAETGTSGATAEQITQVGAPPDPKPQSNAAAAKPGAKNRKVKPRSTDRSGRPRIKPARTPPRPPSRARPAAPARAPTTAETPTPATPPAPEQPEPIPLSDMETIDKFQEVTNLMSSPSPKSRNSLIEMLDDEDPMLRVLAAQGLSSYQDDHILRILMAASRRETDPAAKGDLERIVIQLQSR